MAAPEDVNVDELRRRARRRLVGAIVLALAVAVLVPMLLESDPKPLGEDVSVKIPPVDEGKFVNRLNEKAKTEPAKIGAPKPEPKAEPKTEPKAEAPPKSTEAEPAEPPKVEAAKTEPSKIETPPASAPSGESAPKPATLATAAPKAAPAPAATPTSTPAPAPREPATGEFSVQLAAFSDDKGANSLANKLKKAGYPAYTEPLSTSRGTLWRVRVGPYTSRDSAVASREKLKGEGYSGIVAAAK